MIVSLITENGYQAMHLSSHREGIWQFRDKDGTTLFELVGTAQGWTVRETENGSISAGQKGPLYSGSMLNVRIYKERRAQLYAEDENRQYAKFARCLTPDHIVYTVGSGDDNNFICKNPYISQRHCRLECRDRVWRVTDLQSSTGTYVNGKRIGSTPVALRPGDMVSVLNQKFIVLPGLLAFNAQYLDPQLLKGHVKPIAVPLPPEQPLAAEMPLRYFHRHPRFTDTTQEEDLSVKAPPALQGGPEESPALLTYGPTLLSGASMLMAGMNPLYGIGMLASSILFPKLTRDHANKQRQESEEKRQQLYTEYLNKLEAELKALHGRQTVLLRKQSPAPAGRMEKLLTDNRELWSHRPEHTDYLSLRVGAGDVPVNASISFPEDTMRSADDPMQQKLKEFQEKPRMLHKVPILLDLKRFYSVGISGSSQDRIPFAANLVGQLAMDIGYDDLKLCLIGPLSGPLRHLAWLPHTWTAGQSFHLVAQTRDELDRLAPVLADLVNSDGESRDDLQKKANLVVLITDPALAQSGMLTRLLFSGSLEKVNVITLAGHSAQLPSRTSIAVGLRGDRGRMVWQEEDHREMIDFAPDTIPPELLPKVVLTMANTRLDLQKNAFVLPTMVPFMDLFGVQDVQQLNLLERWSRADTSKYLPAPLGISEDGSISMLDLSEKADGPHGLIAGTTGSGKSELIMTYILSMAVCYSPEDVSFLLIDYKGGGMAQAFAKLPHTVGIITNLDGNEIQRSLASIESELQRRQRVFSEAMRKLGLSKMEIGNYQRFYREGKLSEPMPRLLIITDEFAELKSQQPEFMSKLISAARIGRSLGVHLVLATQQPAGVVSEQIWTNSNFKICLRVQSESDSKQVLKQPDAATLTNPGAYYKQVGAVMIKGQSAWAGADYTPGKPPVFSGAAEVLDGTGGVIKSVEPAVKKDPNAVTQAVAVTKYITETAARAGLSARPLWNPPLEKELSPDALYDRYQPQTTPWVLESVLGELDDPANQSRALVRIPMTAGKNTLVFGGIGSGKLMVLTTILADLMTHHTPDELHAYVLDYADDGLQLLKDAPHVGDVLTADDNERFLRLLAMLEKEVARRKKLMSAAMTSRPIAEKLQEAGLPYLLVVIHGIGKLKNLQDKQMPRLIELMKDGQRWGLTFLATHDAASGLGFQLESCFTQRYVLQMGRDDDYTALLGRTGGMRPAAEPGRGLLRLDGTLYEFQTAKTQTGLPELCRQLQDGWSGACAAPIRTMPERVDAALLMPELDPACPLRLPVGLDPQVIDPVYYPFDSRVVHIALGRKRDVERFLRPLAKLAAQSGLSPLVLDPGSALRALEGVEAPPEEELGTAVDALFEKCRQAMQAKQAGQPFAAESRFILIPSLQSLLASLDDKKREYLRAMLFRAREEWKWVFVLCDTPQNFKSLTYIKEDKEWIGASVSLYDGIYLGGGIRGHGVLSTEGHTKELNSDIVFPFGYVIRDEVPELVRFISEV